MNEAVRYAGDRAWRTLTNGLLVLMALLMMWGLSDEIEAKWFPILIDQRVTNVTIDGVNVCFNLHVSKTRPAQLKSVVFIIDAPNARWFVTPWNVDHGRAMQAITRDPGEIDARWCASLPPAIAAGSLIRVTAWTEYLPSHGLWVVRQKLVEFEVRS